MLSITSMRCRLPSIYRQPKELIAAMVEKGYGNSPGGKTLAAAIGTEINKKGDASRFTRPEPGKFTLVARYITWEHASALLGIRHELFPCVFVNPSTHFGDAHPWPEYPPADVRQVLA